MTKLTRKLAVWEQKKLISPEQRKNIIEYEKNTHTFSLFTGILYLGVFITSLGLISMIAANWNGISGTVKLLINFTLLTAITYGIVTAQKKGKNFIAEILIFALFMMTGASIGLITQVFQTNGSLSGGCLFWALTTLPLLTVSQKKLLPLCWTPLLLLSIFCNSNIWHFFDHFFKYLFNWVIVLPREFHLTFQVGVYVALLGGTAYLINLIFGKKHFIFVVFRRYFEFAAYAVAYFLLFIDDYSNIFNMIVPIITFGTGMLIYHRQHNLKMMNFNIIMIGVSLFSAYALFVSDLLTTGIGLIISGLWLIFLTWVIKTIISKQKTSNGEKK